MKANPFKNRIRIVARGLSFRKMNTEILVVEGVTPRDSHFHHLPGGGVNFLEKGKDALIREYYEELGVNIDPGELLFSDEEIFPDGSGSGCHTVSLVYKVTLPEKCMDVDQLEIDEGRWIYPARWMSISNLDFSHLHPCRLSVYLRGI